MIATAAVQNVLGDDALERAARTPEIVADAAYLIFSKPSREFTGQFLIDDTFLAAESPLTRARKGGRAPAGSCHRPSKVMDVTYRRNEVTEFRGEPNGCHRASIEQKENNVLGQD